MNTARQAGRRQGGAGAAWLATQAASILHAAPTVLAMHPKDFRLFAISGLCGLQINLFVHIDSGFFFSCCFWLALGCGVALVPAGLCFTGVQIGGCPFTAYGCDREDDVSRAIKRL